MNDYITLAVKQLTGKGNFVIYQDGSIKFYDKNVVTPTKEEIETKAKELEFLDKKNNKKQEIKNAYNQAIQEPIEYTVGSETHTFQADNKSQDIIAKVIATEPETVNWLDMNNEFVEMTLDDLKGLAKKIFERNQQYFVKKVDLKKQIDECQDEDCLEQIKW